MRTSLGISAGNEVVCSAVVTTATNGAQSFDYRVVSADVAHSDPGDLVASSIELMTTQMPRDYLHRVGTHTPGASAPQARPVPAGAIAVAYRDREQAMAIRAAIGRQRHDVKLIPESTAALTYLRHTGLLDRYAAVAVIDLGASGMTVTVADLADDTVLRSERTEAISGAAVDEQIYHHLLDCHFARRGTRPNRNMLINRSRVAKEHLSIAPTVTIDHVAGQPLKLTRADFGELIADLLDEAADYSRSVFARAPKLPEAVAIIGGGANIATLVDGLDARLDIPVLSVPEPESATAKGAALVADSAQPSAFSPITLSAERSAGTFTKLVGTLAGAIVVVGLVVGYGVKELVPTAHQDVTPAGTTNTTQATTVPPVQTQTPAGSPTTIPGSRTERQPEPTSAAGQVQQQGGITATTTPGSTSPTTDPDQPTTVAPTTSAPALRPDPNLPQIPLPNLPHLFGPLLGTSTPEPGASEDGTPSPQMPGAGPTKPGHSRIPVLPRSDSGSGGSETAPRTESTTPPSPTESAHPQN